MRVAGSSGNGSPWSPWSGWPQAVGVLALCVLSRLFTTLHHIEDADSLRFALALVDYDVTRLQPQFPGYPVFCFFVKILYLITGSYSVAFSLTGGLGLFVLIHYSLSLLEWRSRDARGMLLAALLFFNPMIWLLGNRFMSDLSGAACMLAAFYHLSRTDSRKHALAGFFLAGILAGWRLSYAPFLIVPLLWSLRKRRSRAEKVSAGVFGVLVWMIPLILLTGWSALIATAEHQTAAHFVATGGTYVTESAWPVRIGRIFAYLWTDGLGAWWPGRNPVTAWVGAGAILLLVAGILRALRFRAGRARRAENEPVPMLVLLTASCAVYAVWIGFFQNVIHQTRHVLPLVPPLLMLLAAGIGSAWNSAKAGTAARKGILLLLALWLAAYAVVGTTLAVQHKRPAAIAQAKAWLETYPDSSLLVISAPWVQKCLSAQGVRMRYLAVETPEELEALRKLNPRGPFVTIGNYTDYLDLPVRERRVFFHNPYVNRLGSKVEAFVYEGRGGGPDSVSTGTGAPVGHP